MLTYLKTLPFAMLVMVLVSAGRADERHETAADSLLAARKHFSFAVQYKQSGSLEKALDNYERSLDFVDSLYQVHYSYADLLMKLDRKEEARRELLATLRLNPSHFNSAAILAGQYYEEACYDSALVMYEIMLEGRPDDPAIRASVARLRSYLGKDGDALESFMTMIGDGTATPADHERALEIAISRGETDTVGRILELSRTNGADIPSLFTTAAAYFMKTGDTGAAMRNLLAAVERNPSDIESYERLADIAEKTGDAALAAKALAGLHSNMPENVEILTALAENHLQAGRESEAVALIDTGLSLAPENGKLHILKGTWHREQGRPDEAVAEFEAALADERWEPVARQFIWQIRPPETDEEKAERNFFERSRKQDDGN